MPALGETIWSKRLGARSNKKLAWSACENCGAERWACAYRPPRYCQKCWNRSKFGEIAGKGPNHNKNQAREGNNNWRGGAWITDAGYRMVLLGKDDPLLSMATSGRYVLEHRLAMARQLARPLQRNETVHHKNGDRLDNRLENLELWSSRHPRGARVGGCPRCDSLTSADAIRAEIERLSQLLQEVRHD